MLTSITALVAWTSARGAEGLHVGTYCTVNLSWIQSVVFGQISAFYKRLHNTHIIVLYVQSCSG